MKNNQLRPMVFMAGWLALILTAAPILLAQGGRDPECRVKHRDQAPGAVQKGRESRTGRHRREFHHGRPKSLLLHGRGQFGHEQTLVFRWLFQDEEYFRLETNIGTSTNWRTSSMVTLRAGSWKVEILQNEQVLQEIAFTVSE